MRRITLAIAMATLCTGCEDRATRQEICNSMATVIEAAAALGQGAQPEACIPVINANANAVILIHGGQAYTAEGSR